MKRGVAYALVASCPALAGLWSEPASAAGLARCLGYRRAVAADVCVDRKSPRASEIVAAMHELQEQYSFRAVPFGVWTGRKELVTGALGNAYPGVPADRRMHFRIGNTTDSLTSALLELRQTVMTTTAATPPPVLHGYTDERGVVGELLAPSAPPNYPAGQTAVAPAAGS